MSAMSDYLEAKILDHVLSTTAYTMPSGVFVGLSTGSFGDDNSGTGGAAYGDDGSGAPAGCSLCGEGSSVERENMFFNPVFSMDDTCGNFDDTCGNLLNCLRRI